MISVTFFCHDAGTSYVKLWWEKIFSAIYLVGILIIPNHAPWVCIKDVLRRDISPSSRIIRSFSFLFFFSSSSSSSPSSSSSVVTFLPLEKRTIRATSHWGAFSIQFIFLYWHSYPGGANNCFSYIYIFLFSTVLQSIELVQIIVVVTVNESQVSLPLTTIDTPSSPPTVNVSTRVGFVLYFFFGTIKDTTITIRW